MRPPLDVTARMAEQPSLFEEPADPNRIALAIPGSAPSLSRAQKQFNTLLGQIAKLRERLAEWQDYPPNYDRRVSEEIEPLNARLREARIAMTAVFDRALSGKGLTRPQRNTALDVLEHLLRGLIEEAPDPALAALAERHGLEMASEDAGLGDLLEIFGMQLDAEHSAAAAEELLRMAGEKRQAEQAERSAKRKPAAKSSKAQAREVQAEQAAKDASQALREIYRQLVRELHPDRIADADERSRKTVLMQEANRAYEARDLLALLELQWRIEQIDPAHIAGLAEEKLIHFNHVFKEQAHCLRAEIDAFAAPFALHFFDRAVPRELRPAHIERELDGELAELRSALRRLLADTERYADLAELKRDLKASLKMVAMPDIDFDGLYEEMMGEFGSPPPRRRR